MIEAGTLQIDRNCCDGKEIRPGVWGIGPINWNAEAEEWRTLANVHGMLCLISLSLRPCSPIDAVDEQQP